MLKIVAQEMDPRRLCLYNERLKVMDEMADIVLAYVDGVDGGSLGDFLVRISIYNNPEGKGKPEIECVITSDDPSKG